MESQITKTMLNLALNSLHAIGMNQGLGMIISVKHVMAGFVRSVQVKRGYGIQLYKVILKNI